MPYFVTQKLFVRLKKYFLNFKFISLKFKSFSHLYAKFVLKIKLLYTLSMGPGCFTVLKREIVSMSHLKKFKYINKM